MKLALERHCGNRHVDMGILLQAFDVVLVAMPVTPKTHRLPDARERAVMKSGAILADVARGGAIDELALTNALEHHDIAAAGPAVFRAEPAIPPALLKLDNVGIGSAHRERHDEYTRSGGCRR